MVLKYISECQQEIRMGRLALIKKVLAERLTLSLTGVSQGSVAERKDLVDM